MRLYKAYGNYYKKIRKCKGRFKGMYEWQPVKKVWIFFVKDKTKRKFILDDYGFIKL